MEVVDITYRQESQTHIAEVDGQVVLLLLLLVQILQAFVVKLLCVFLWDRKTENSEKKAFFLLFTHT